MDKIETTTTNKQKINILIVPSDRTGVSMFRSVEPHLKLEELFPDEFKIDIDYNPKIDDENFIKQYQIIHFHRTLGPFEQMERRMGDIRKHGVITVLDLDDYWLPTKDHPAYYIIKEQKLDEKIVKNLSLAQYVTTTTKIFADEIKKYNKNVVVFPNAIDQNDQQFRIKPNDDVNPNRVRIGWLGGASHIKDLEILRGVSNKLNTFGYTDKLQFVLCGFDTRGEINKINQETNQVEKRKIKPEETVWKQYEEIVTDNYRIIKDANYLKYLNRYSEDPYDVYDQPYRRIWTKPVTTYATNYNNFDISLAPLEETTFNRVKSQLKVLEAGFFKKPIIAQDFGPYTIDIKNAYEEGKFVNGGNGLLVPSIKNHKLWYKSIKLLIDNPNFRLDIGEKLYEDVSIKYNLEKVSKDRAEWYKQIVKL